VRAGKNEDAEWRYVEVVWSGGQSLENSKTELIIEANCEEPKGD
jgi:hypothetical protein